MGLDFEADKRRMNPENCKPGPNFLCKRKLKSSQLNEAPGLPGCNRDVSSHVNTHL